MYNDYIKEIDDNNWEKIVEKGDKPVFVMFYSPTCPTCKAMKPHFMEYAKEFKDKVVFSRINVMNNPDAVSKYGVMGTPTFKFFCKGKPVQEIVGAVYPHLLKKNVEEALQRGPECVKNTTWADSSISGYS